MCTFCIVAGLEVIFINDFDAEMMGPSHRTISTAPYRWLNASKIFCLLSQGKGNEHPLSSNKNAKKAKIKQHQMQREQYKQ